MEIKEYQKKAMKTCLHESNNFSYMFLNLVGEVGELASKVAKSIRKKQSIVIDNELFEDKNINNDLKLEAGDILWQLSGLCSTMNWSLEEIAKMNLDKLASRQKRNKIEGDGDNR